MRRSALPDSGTFEAAFSGINALRPILLALTAVAALSVAYPAKANLITNGDFETGDFTGWTVAHAASGSLILVGPEVGPDTTLGAIFGATGTDLDAISQTFATTPGTFYTLTFFYQVANFGTAPNNEFNVLWNGTSVGSPFPNINANDGFARLHTICKPRAP